MQWKHIYDMWDDEVYMNFFMVTINYIKKLKCWERTIQLKGKSCLLSFWISRSTTYWEVHVPFGVLLGEVASHVSGVLLGEVEISALKLLSLFS